MLVFDGALDYLHFNLVALSMSLASLLHIAFLIARRSPDERHCLSETGS